MHDDVNAEIPSEDEIYEEVTPTEIPVEGRANRHINPGKPV